MNDTENCNCNCNRNIVTRSKNRSMMILYTTKTPPQLFVFLLLIIVSRYLSLRSSFLGTSDLFCCFTTIFFYKSTHAHRPGSHSLLELVLMISHNDKRSDMWDRDRKNIFFNIHTINS